MSTSKEPDTALHQINKNRRITPFRNRYLSAAPPRAALATAVAPNRPGELTYAPATAGGAAHLTPLPGEA